MPALPPTSWRVDARRGRVLHDRLEVVREARRCETAETDGRSGSRCDPWPRRPTKHPWLIRRLGSRPIVTGAVARSAHPVVEHAPRLGPTGGADGAHERLRDASTSRPQPSRSPPSSSRSGDRGRRRRGRRRSRRARARARPRARGAPSGGARRRSVRRAGPRSRAARFAFSSGSLGRRLFAIGAHFGSGQGLGRGSAPRPSRRPHPWASAARAQADEPDGSTEASTSTCRRRATGRARAGSTTFARAPPRAMRSLGPSQTGGETSTSSFARFSDCDV